jgi:hypothetical protein
MHDLWRGSSEQQRDGGGHRFIGKKRSALGQLVRGPEDVFGNHQGANEAENQIRLPRRGETVRLHAPTQHPEVGHTRERTQRHPVLDEQVALVRGGQEWIFYPERMREVGQEVQRALGKTHHKQHHGADGEHHEGGEDDDVHGAGGSFLGIHHALLAQAEKNQGLGAGRRIVEAIFLAHVPQHAQAPEHDDAEVGQGCGQNQRGENRAHGSFVVSRWRGATSGTVARRRLRASPCWPSIVWETAHRSTPEPGKSPRLRRETST